MNMLRERTLFLLMYHLDEANTDKAQRFFDSSGLDWLWEFFRIKNNQFVPWTIACSMLVVYCQKSCPIIEILCN